MASLTLADAASRAGPMSEAKKPPKRWKPKSAQAAVSHEAAQGDESESRNTGTLSRPFSSMKAAAGRHNLYKQR